MNARQRRTKRRLVKKQAKILVAALLKQNRDEIVGRTEQLMKDLLVYGQVEVSPGRIVYLQNRAQ